MAWHRQIDVRVWGDEKFRALSAPQPNAQSLWFYLLTGPHTLSIPGLSAVGEAAIAEAMGWSLEGLGEGLAEGLREGFPKGFREAFRELSDKGMVKADWGARVLWLPNAIRYNPPANPNVIKSWRTHWDIVPECPLKEEARQQLKAFLEGFSEGFREAFDKACPKGSGNGSGNGMANQKQKQKQNNKNTPAAAGTPTTTSSSRPDPKPDATANREAKPDPSGNDEPKPVRAADGASAKSSRKESTGAHAAIVKAFCDGWQGRYREKYPFNGSKDGEHVKWMLSQVDGDVERAKRIVAAYLADTDAFLAKNRHGLGLLRSQFHRFVVNGTPRPPASPVSTAREEWGL